MALLTVQNKDNFEKTNSNNNNNNNNNGNNNNIKNKST